MSEDARNATNDGINAQPAAQADPAQQYPDCFSCRATGTVVMGGISVYCLWERSKVARSLRGDRFALALMAAGAAGLSVYRAFGW